MKSTNGKTKNELQEVIKYAYLNLGDLDQYDLSGPFNQPIFDLVDEHAPPMPLLNTMLNPKYLGFNYLATLMHYDIIINSNCFELSKSDMINVTTQLLLTMM